MDNPYILVGGVLVLFGLSSWGVIRLLLWLTFGSHKK